MTGLARELNFSNMSRGELLDFGEVVSNSLDLLNQIQSMLVANCKSDAALGKLGIEYNKNRNVVVNLVYILEKLIFATERKDMTVDEIIKWVEECRERNSGRSCGRKDALVTEIKRLRIEKRSLGDDLRAIAREYKLLDD